MAYNYEYPYCDPHRYNSDWLLKTTKETQERMTALEQKEADFENNINAQWTLFKENTITELNQWKTTTEQSFNDSIKLWENATIDNLNTWKSATERDLNQSILAWERETISNLNNWKSDTLTDWQNKYNDFTTSINSQFNAFKNEITKDYNDFTSSITTQFEGFKTTINNNIQALQDSFNTLQADITTFENNINSQIQTLRSDITSFENDINNKIADQNAKIRDMQAQLDNVPDQIRSELEPALQEYVANLIPGYDFNKMAIEARYKQMSELYGRNIDVYLCYSNSSGDLPQDLINHYKNTLKPLTNNVNVRKISGDKSPSTATAGALLIYCLSEDTIAVDVYQSMYRWIATHYITTYAVVIGHPTALTDYIKYFYMMQYSTYTNYLGSSSASLNYNDSKINLDFLTNIISSGQAVYKDAQTLWNCSINPITMQYSGYSNTQTPPQHIELFSNIITNASNTCQNSAVLNYYYIDTPGSVSYIVRPGQRVPQSYNSADNHISTIFYTLT